MELYHVLNRGVDKRTIFMDDQDRARFVHDLYEFNDTKPAWNSGRDLPMIDFVNQSSSATTTHAGDRELIVNLHGWVLMGNHYHLLLSEKVDGGITKFLRKLNVGYANYFNERYDRSGSLYQGRTKKVLIENDAHFLYILHYLHLNPLDQLRGAATWREKKLNDSSVALQHLRNYRWSSYQDYCGIKNFPSLLTTSLFHDVFGNIERATKRYIEDMSDTVKDLRSLTLE